MDEDKNKDDIQQQVNGGQDDNRPQDKPDAAADGQDAAAREDADAPDEEQADDERGDYKPADRFDASAVHHLSRMYKNWFLDYASYVILERAVPAIEDGLKPVQRRILHSMKRMDDGRYNKVANIVGYTMQFHPHGDASIGDALVQLGQKNLLVDSQGNWGNILTGDRAAAPRYIEARLSKFALDVAFNPKTTEWQLSYDGRNKEPIALPVKFPLLLAQGAEGIAVGLSSKVLPHNFNELCDAAVSYLQGREYHLYPDFPTGGAIDVSKYNDGQRGGVVKVRAKIEKLDPKTLVIREIPFSKTTESLIDSIKKAIDKGKIKVRKVEDMTAAEAEIQLHLQPGTSSDKTLDALYAFTDCEVSISPNCCVIRDQKPCFLTVSEVLEDNVNRTRDLLRRELEIERGELQEQLFYASLERIFIEQRMYKDPDFEQAPNEAAVVRFLEQAFLPFRKDLLRDITRDDYLRLLEIKMQRILKYNKDKADKLMAKLRAQIKHINHDLAHLTDVTIKWFEYLKEKYGADHPRLTEIRNFDTIEAAKVVEANEKLYINRKEGFIGTGLKKDEMVCPCADIDDIIIFYRDGKYKVIRVADKIFVGQGVIHLQVFKRNDRRTIYNVVYRDGRQGDSFIKRFNVTTVMRDKEYDLTKGTPGSRVLYFSANPNGEAEVIKVTLEPDPKRAKSSIFMEKDFSEIDIKGRAAQGRLLTHRAVHRISLKSHGRSTLGGRKVWFDPDVLRINYEEHGRLLGEFNDGDRILVVLRNGTFYTTDFDVNNHYENSISIIEKFDPHKVWTAVLFDADNKGFLYIKRFAMDAVKKPTSLLNDNPDSRLMLLTDTAYPHLRITFGGNDAPRTPLEIDAESFAVQRSYKAHGRRLTTYEVATVEELEPLRQPEQPETSETAVAGEDENLDPDAGKSEQDVIDEMTGQLNLFNDGENNHSENKEDDNR